MENKKQVIVVIGPPGSGKGTQTEMLAAKFNLNDFEMSKIIEEHFNNAGSDDTVLIDERRKWANGDLVSPELVLQWMLEKVGIIRDLKDGIIFSGNPRSIFEAHGLFPILEKYYGKENIKVINIELNEEESIKRNSTRRICVANRHPIPNFEEFINIDKCPKDGSAITTRPLDNPKVIKERYHIYLQKTLPILDFLKERGYEIIHVNGEQTIDKVQESILAKL